MAADPILESVCDLPIPEPLRDMRTVHLQTPPSVEPCKTSFSSFSLLPIELRDAIWRLALPKPTLVALYDDFSLPVNGPGSEHSWYSNVPVPVLLGVCKESRAEVLRHYECAFKDENGNGGFWVDFEVDVFWLRSFKRPDENFYLNDFMGDFQKIHVLVLSVCGADGLEDLILDGKDILEWWPPQIAPAISKLEFIILLNLNDGELEDLLECEESAADLLEKYHCKLQDNNQWEIDRQRWLAIKGNSGTPLLFSYHVKPLADWACNPTITVPRLGRQKLLESMTTDGRRLPSNYTTVTTIRSNNIVLTCYRALESSYVPS